MLTQNFKSDPFSLFPSPTPFLSHTCTLGRGGSIYACTHALTHTKACLYHGITYLTHSKNFQVTQGMRQRCLCRASDIPRHSIRPVNRCYMKRKNTSETRFEPRTSNSLCICDKRWPLHHRIASCTRTVSPKRKSIKINSSPFKHRVFFM